MILLYLIVLCLAPFVGGALGWLLFSHTKLWVRIPATIIMSVGMVWLSYVLLGLIFPNKAAVTNAKYVRGITTLHPTLICDNGDSGYGPDNATPWYTAYYYIDAVSSADESIKTAAKTIGLELREDIDRINRLKNQQSSNFGDNKYVATTSYLKGGKLTVSVVREGSVFSQCLKGWGSTIPVTPSHYLLMTNITD